MNKVLLSCIATCVAFILVSCGGKDAPVTPTTKDAIITHTYKITSSAPIEMSLNVTSATSSPAISGDIFLNGVDQKTNVFNQDIAHEGSKSYDIKATSIFLSTFITITTDEVDEVEVTYEWTSTINGKQVKSDKGMLIIGGVKQTKVYQTEL